MTETATADTGANAVHGYDQADWIRRAHHVLPAGGFGNFDPGIVIREGRGARVWDEDGKEYVDFLLGSGPMLVGHGHPEVVEAVQQQITRGFTFFASNAAGIELAEVICEAVPCAEQLRYVSTGSEADMYAMRLARAHTGRDKIVKFEGGYHGMSAEALMSLAPQRSGNFPHPVADSAGIPAAVADQILVAPFNDVDFFRSLLDEHEGEVAGVIVEPFQRLIPPEPGFLEALRAETERRGIVLIFDEVVTGFRLCYRGAQDYYGVTPDLCTLGKVIGGGFPLAAVAGSRDIMAHFDKSAVGAEGFTFQVGTLSGNPVAAVAGLKTLEILRRPGTYEGMRKTGETLMDGIRRTLADAGIDGQIVGEPVLFDVVFTSDAVRDYRSYLTGDTKRLRAYNAVLRQEGLLKTDTKFYISAAHGPDEIEQSLAAFKTAARAIAAG